jgi:hypothetical protein
MVPAPEIDVLPPELLEKIFHGLRGPGGLFTCHLIFLSVVEPEPEDP